jgi:Fe-S cluster assembly iron-binding protein IscA
MIRISETAARKIRTLMAKQGIDDLFFLSGTVFDYDTNMISKGFVFNNPNAKSTCGCGSSFGA